MESLYGKQFAGHVARHNIFARRNFFHDNPAGFSNRYSTISMCKSMQPGTSVSKGDHHHTCSKQLLFHCWFSVELMVSLADIPEKAA